MGSTVDQSLKGRAEENRTALILKVECFRIFRACRAFLTILFFPAAANNQFEHTGCHTLAVGQALEGDHTGSHYNLSKLGWFDVTPYVGPSSKCCYPMVYGVIVQAHSKYLSNPFPQCYRLLKFVAKEQNLHYFIYLSYALDMQQFTRTMEKEISKCGV